MLAPRAAGPFPTDIFLSGLCRVNQRCLIVLGERRTKESSSSGCYIFGVPQLRHRFSHWISGVMPGGSVLPAWQV